MKKSHIISEVVGDFGPWQRRVFFVSFFVNLVGIWQNLAITFLAPEIEYSCTSPIGDVCLNNVSSPAPIASGQWSTNGTADECHVKIPYGCDGNTTTVSCTKWHYDTSVYASTIASEWDLVCDRQWMISFSKSVYMVGYMISVFVFGQLSDYIGRFPTMIVCYVMMLISSVLSPFSTSYVMFVVLRLFMSFGRGGLMTTTFVLLMEITGPKWSAEITIASQFGWAVGFSTLPGLAWYFRSWYWLQAAIGIPVIPLICVFWIVPESPRWLLSQNKMEQYYKVLSKGARINGKKMDIDEFYMKEQPPTDEKTKKTIIDVLRTPRIRTRFLIVAFAWIANVYIYFAFSYNTDDLGGDVYLNFFLSGVVEIPSYAAIFVIRKFGRRLPFIIGMFVTAAAFGVIMIIPEDLHWVILTVAMIGKFSVTATFGLLYIYTMELFPTVVRNVTLGCCSTIGRVAATISPFVRDLGDTTHHSVPYAINAALSLVAGALAFLLPETKGTILPDTLNEKSKEYTTQMEMISKF